MSKVLLGGGAGLCGSWLSRHLLSRGYQVIILDNFSESFRENVPLGKDLTCYQVDINNFDEVKVIFNAERPDYVFSMQAMAAEIASPFVKARTYRDCLITTANLISNSVQHDVQKFIHFSSVAIWSGRNDPPYFEDTPPSPADSYSIAKWMAELECKITHEQFGLDYSIVRCHNFQGPYLNYASLYRNFLGIAVRQALSDEPITIFGAGDQTRQFSHVKYLCEPLERLLEVHCPVVNLGSDTNYTVLEVAKIIQSIAKRDGKKVDIIHLPARHEALHASCDHGLAKDKLGFKDETDIEYLCYEIYHWVKKQPKREHKKMNFEITKNLPLSWI